MLQIAGGILLAILALALLPVAFAAVRGTLRFGANSASLFVVIATAALPVMGALILAEHLLPGYGAIAAIWLLVVFTAVFAGWETLRFRRWKRSILGEAKRIYHRPFG